MVLETPRFKACSEEEALRRAADLRLHILESIGGVEALQALSALDLNTTSDVSGNVERKIEEIEYFLKQKSVQKYKITPSSDKFLLLRIAKIKELRSHRRNNVEKGFFLPHPERVIKEFIRLSSFPIKNPKDIFTSVNNLLSTAEDLFVYGLKNLSLQVIRAPRLTLFIFITDRLRSLRQDAIQLRLQAQLPHHWVQLLLLSLRFHTIAARLFPDIHTPCKTERLSQGMHQICFSKQQAELLYSPSLNNLLLGSCLHQLIFACREILENPTLYNTKAFALFPESELNYTKNVDSSAIVIENIFAEALSIWCLTSLSNYEGFGTLGVKLSLKLLKTSHLYFSSNSVSLLNSVCNKQQPREFSMLNHLQKCLKIMSLVKEGRLPLVIKIARSLPLHLRLCLASQLDQFRVRFLHTVFRCSSPSRQPLAISTNRIAKWLAFSNSSDAVAMIFELLVDASERNALVPGIKDNSIFSAQTIFVSSGIKLTSWKQRALGEYYPVCFASEPCNTTSHCCANNAAALAIMHNGILSPPVI